MILDVYREMKKNNRFDMSKNLWDQATQEFRRLCSIGELHDPEDILNNFAGGNYAN